MKLLRAWLLLVQVVFSQPHADHPNSEALELKQPEGATPKVLTTTQHQEYPTKGPRDAPRRSKAVQSRDELPPGTKAYNVWVTDRANEAQIKETQEWLEGLVKDKSKMVIWKDYPWGKELKVPEEIEKLFDEGRVEEVDKYEQVHGWWRLILDQAGYEEVQKKKEWIAEITENRSSVEMSPFPGSQGERPQKLESRKVEWGDWKKQENAIRELVHASQYE